MRRAFTTSKLNERTIDGIIFAQGGGLVKKISETNIDG